MFEKEPTDSVQLLLTKSYLGDRNAGLSAPPASWQDFCGRQIEKVCICVSVCVCVVQLMANDY